MSLFQFGMTFADYIQDNVVNQTVLSRVLKIKGMHTFPFCFRTYQQFTTNSPFISLPFSYIGYLVEIANNGAEGIERYRTSALANDWFNVVFMDLQMPVMDGLTCTELIRKFEIEVPHFSLAHLSISLLYHFLISHIFIYLIINVHSHSFMQMGRPPALIIGLSGNARDEYKHTALAAGMNECILPPPSLTILSSSSIFSPLFYFE